MKKSMQNQYVIANQILIGLVSMVMGYNIYQAINHPENSNLILSIILVILTSITVKKYGYKTTANNSKPSL